MLQLRLKVRHVSIVRSPFFGLPFLLTPGRNQSFHDFVLGFGVAAQGSEQQTLRGVGGGEFLYVLELEVLQSLEGLGWYLLSNSGAECSPGCGVVHYPAGDAFQYGCATAGLAGQGIGLDAPGKQSFFEARDVFTQLRKHSSSLQPGETVLQEFLRQILRRKRRRCKLGGVCRRVCSLSFFVFGYVI